MGRPIYNCLFKWNDRVADSKFDSRGIIVLDIFQTLFKVYLTACGQDILPLRGDFEINRWVRPVQFSQTIHESCHILKFLWLDRNLNKSHGKAFNFGEIRAVRCRTNGACLQEDVVETADSNNATWSCLLDQLETCAHHKE